jgi:two-component sensor histidine kinase
MRRQLEWRETGGPAVAPHTHCGFGLQLLSAGLAESNGSTETLFDPTGLICKMKATLVGNPPATAPQVLNEPSASLDPAV